MFEARREMDEFPKLPGSSNNLLQIGVCLYYLLAMH